MTYKFAFVLLGIFVVAPVALFFLLRWILSKLLRSNSLPGASYAVTQSGFILYGTFMLALVIGTASYRLEPNGALGSLLKNPNARLIAVLIVTICVTVAERLLRRFGYPTIVVSTRDQSNHAIDRTREST